MKKIIAVFFCCWGAIAAMQRILQPKTEKE